MPGPPATRQRLSQTARQLGLWERGEYSHPGAGEEEEEISDLDQLLEDEDFIRDVTLEAESELTNQKFVDNLGDLELQYVEDFDLKDDNRTPLMKEKTKPISKVMRFRCGFCDKLFCEKMALDEHIVSHDQMKPFTCTNCDGTFRYKPSLVRHKNICNFDPSSKSSTNEYKARDSKSNPKRSGKKYPCNQCDYQASYMHHLKQHIQSTHEGIKYPCNQCDYQATQKGDLQRHIQSQHEGIKYPCNQCDYQATQKSSLQTHIQSKHEGIKYPCSQCNYQATLKGDLHRHFRSM